MSGCSSFARSALQKRRRKTLKGDFKYKLYWKGEDTANGSVGLIMKREDAKLVLDV